MDEAVWVRRLDSYLKGNGLRLTAQRRLIAKTFFNAEDHLDVETLYNLVKANDSSVGQATVYRTLRVLVDSGLANRSHFGGPSARYEVADGHHHDHLICLGCNAIIEFHNETIERLQDTIAEEHGYVLESHKMELYGRCSDCRSAS